MPDSHRPVQTVVLQADDAGVTTAAQLLDDGGLVALPTETVYGLAADAENLEAVASIFSAKGRPATQPLIVHISAEWGPRYSSHWSGQAQALSEAFWPGPVTIVVPRSQIVPMAVTGGLDSVGLRCPRHPIAAAVISELGRGVAAPSANRYGHVSPTTAQHVLDDLAGRLDAVVDAGACDVGLESTIVDLSTEGAAVLLRAGAITPDQIEDVIGIEVTDGTHGPVRAPGMVLSHYAPLAPVEVVSAAELARRSNSLDDSVLVISNQPTSHPRSVHLRGDVAFASGLYDALRKGDDPDVTAVLVAPPTDGALAGAIRDRLQRAAHG